MPRDELIIHWKNLMKHVGFTGSRKGLMSKQKAKLKEVIRLVASSSIEAHHGLCRGADDEFHRIVEEIYDPTARTIVGHPPTDKTHYVPNRCDVTREDKEYITRNHNIVDESDILIACPDGPEKHRSGTWSTIRYAKKKGKAVFVVLPDGSFS